MIWCNKGEGQWEMISIEFKQRLFEFNPKVFEGEGNSMQGCALNISRRSDTDQGRYFWEVRSCLSAMLEELVELWSSLAEMLASDLKASFALKSPAMSIP